MIGQSALEFGDIDAKHEVFAQARLGQDIFFRSFQIPPGLDEFAMMQGARFFVIGQKGSGKTALLRFLQENYRRAGHPTEIVLFKSDLNEDERQRLISGSDVSVIEAINTAQKGADYKSNWLWYIIVQLSYMLSSDQLISGGDSLHDLKVLTGASQRPKQSVFTGMRLTKLKGDIKANLNIGMFKSEARGEIEAIIDSADRPEIDVIETAERCLCRLKLKHTKRVALFFDELELFTSQTDQRTRDLILIRDLLYAVSRINRKLGAYSASIVVYASVRSEVLNEINVLSEEINKETDDFGVRIEWDIRSQSLSQPLLELVSAKIRASEAELGENETADIWRSYFPDKLFGKDFRQHLLDISMFRPRNVVRRLKGARRRPDAHGFSVSDFEDSHIEFSNGVWKEVEDEIRVIYKPEITRAIKQVLSGWQSRFELYEFERRIESANHIPSGARNLLRRADEVKTLIETLYRTGAIGNFFYVESGGRRQPRDRWIFRGYTEPLFDKEFVVHESVRKALQLGAT